MGPVQTGPRGQGPKPRRPSHPDRLPLTGITHASIGLPEAMTRTTTRVELSNSMLDYIEIFYNRRRRQSKLGYVSPIEYERTLDPETA